MKTGRNLIIGAILALSASGSIAAAGVVATSAPAGIVATGAQAVPNSFYHA